MKYASFNRFEFAMPDEAIRDCHHQGSCDGEVERWQGSGKINLSHISDDDLAAELKEYGAWDSEELKDRTANEQRIIWIAAGNIQDETDE
jgi:hypothetical protein